MGGFFNAKKPNKDSIHTVFLQLTFENIPSPIYFYIQERAAYEVEVLQKALDESVSLSELESANKQYTELTVKYRDLLQRDSHLIQRSSQLEHLEVRRHHLLS